TSSASSPRSTASRRNASAISADTRQNRCTSTCSASWTATRSWSGSATSWDWERRSPSTSATGPYTMVEQAIGLGLVISLLFSETLGLAAGGMVVPGYLALMIHQPLRIAGTVLVALVTYACMKLLSRYVLIYGRRRIVVAVLLGFTFGA